MSRHDRKQRSYSQKSDRQDRQLGSSRLSNQIARDRLRESRTSRRDPYHESASERANRKRSSASSSRQSYREASREGHSRGRSQREELGSPSQRHPSQPELRLRAPKRQHTPVGSNYESRSRAAERERAAGRRAGQSRSSLNAPRVAKRSLSQVSTDPRRATSAVKEKDLQRKALSDLAEKPRRQSREERDVSRKQRERRGEQRLQLFKIATMAVAALSALSLLLWGGFAIANSSLFYPEEVEVQGLRFLNSDELKEAAQVDPESSVITMDTDAIEARLRTNPWISNVSVSTSFPSGVQIEVTERTPAIRVETDGPDWVASSDGKWLGTIERDASEIQDPSGTVSPVNTEGLSIIPVAGILEPHAEWGEQTNHESLLNVLAHLRGLDSRIVSGVLRISAPEVGRTSFFTSDEVELDLGRAENLTDKSTIILNILEEYGENVVLINVRSVDHPTWRGLSR